MSTEDFLKTEEIDPLLLKRKIIHFDMDAFYAAVEIRDNPSLQDKPLVIGGPPQSRSVVCTASYLARRYGIRSAMACSQAARLCSHAVFLPPDFQKYKAISNQIRSIFSRYTDLIEPLSLDEAYLDVTKNKMQLYAVQIAKRIKNEIKQELQLTGSAGVAPNKLVAKIASDINKPDGLTIVLPEQVTSFMAPLPLRKINGIGPATEKRLHQNNLYTCADVWQHSKENLIDLLGENFGEWLYDSSRGIDDSAVETHWVRKSLGQEETFSEDTTDMPWLLKKLEDLSQEVSLDLKRNAFQGKTITLKVKYADFKQITRSQTLAHHTDTTHEIFDAVKILIEKTECGKKKVRLLGISVSHFL